LLARNFGNADIVWRQFLEGGFLFRRSGCIYTFVNRIPQISGELTVDFPWISSQPRGDFCREQAWNNSVLVRGPYATAAPEKRRARALFASEAQSPGQQAFDKPL